MGKVSLFTGLAAGYVLGTRAGRERYEKIRRLSSKAWQSAPVQKQVTGAKQAARTKLAPAVADKVGEIAHSTADRLRRDDRLLTAEVVATADAPPDDAAAEPTAHRRRLRVPRRRH